MDAKAPGVVPHRETERVTKRTWDDDGYEEGWTSPLQRLLSACQPVAARFGVTITVPPSSSSSLSADGSGPETRLMQGMYGPGAVSSNQTFGVLPPSPPRRG